MKPVAKTPQPSNVRVEIFKAMNVKAPAKETTIMLTVFVALKDFKAKLVGTL
jgi:hypothetical protein